MKYKPLLIIVTMAIAIFALISAALIAIDLQNKQLRRQVQVASLEYAKNECIKSSRSNQICNNLEAVVDDPPDWGTHDYIVYIFYHNNDLFDASMSVSIENGKPKVSGFGIIQTNLDAILRHTTIEVKYKKQKRELSLR